MSLKKKAGKSIALALVGVSILTPTLNTVSAMENNKTISINNENLNMNIIEDSAEKKIVEVKEGNKIYKSIFNKKNNTLKTMTIENGKIEQKAIADLNKANSENMVTLKSTRATEYMKCMYSKLKYSINMKSWTITNSKGKVKKRPETKSHKDNLYRFRDAVKASRRSENYASASLDTAKIAALAGIITSATGAGAVISAVTALGGSLSAAYNLWDSIVERREADRYFALL